MFGLVNFAHSADSDATHDGVLADRSRDIVW
jgi:hypothetical protein